LKKNTKLIHLSHIDLDGYGCQFLTHSIKNIKNKIFLNANYGKEIEEKLYLIKNIISSTSIEEKIFLLITDLNLNETQCKFIQDLIKEFENLEVQLLDHHKTAEELTKKYSWYKLDTSKCGTKLTYEWYLENSIIEFREVYLNFLVDIIDIYDRWIETDPNFDLATALDININSKIFYENDDLVRDIKFLILEYFVFIVAIEGENIKEFEDFVSLKIKEFINDSISKEFSDDNIPLLIKQFRLSFEHNFKEENLFLIAQDIITLKNKTRIFIMFNSDARFFQYYSNWVLKQDLTKIDIVMKVSKEGSISARSRNEIDVSKIMKKHFNGGGHKNAAGGTLNQLIKTKEDAIEKLTKILVKEPDPLNSLFPITELINTETNNNLTALFIHENIIKSHNKEYKEPEKFSFIASIYEDEDITFNIEFISNLDVTQNIKSFIERLFSANLSNFLLSKELDLKLYYFDDYTEESCTYFMFEFSSDSIYIFLGFIYENKVKIFMTQVGDPLYEILNSNLPYCEITELEI